MSTLDDLLHQARRLDRSERINLRDPIAEFGNAAIHAVRPWVSDPELGAFAVRVLEKVAERTVDRPRVIEALESIDLIDVKPAIARDVNEALDRLGRRRVTAADRRKTAGPKPWSGYGAARPLERRFHDDMLDVFRLAGEATRKERPDGTFIRGYWAHYFLRAVRNHGGVAYAHQLLTATGTTAGFERLTDEGRLDLTMEALVLRTEYESLFSQAERQVAAARLARAGYQPGIGPRTGGDR